MPIPETIELVKSDLVDAVTRVAKVDALKPCSAYNIKISSSASIFSGETLSFSNELATTYSSTKFVETALLSTAIT